MIEKINEIFDKVYVITYDESTRLNTLAKRLDGLEYEIFYGCNKKNVEVEKLVEQGYCEIHGGAGLYSSSNFACTFSHLYLYEKLKKENLNNVLILEDDVIIIENAIENMIFSYQNLPTNWDLFYLGLSNQSKNYNNVLSKNYNNIMYKGEKLKMGDFSKGVLLPLEGTNAYAINNNFLDLALTKQLNPTTMNPIADGLMFYLYYALEFFACVPQVFPQIDNFNHYNEK